MGLLQRLRPPQLDPPNTREDWAATEHWRAWPSPHNLVVGESHRQQHIRTLAGEPREGGWCVPVNVTFTRDSANPHDANAWAAHVSGGHVGYLRRDIAEHLSAACDPAGCHTFVVPGVVRGGWLDADMFGVHVWLDRLITPGPEIHISGIDTEVSWPPDDDERSARPLPPAGWYRDPQGAERWWDGAQWTEHRR